jgi:hypothetical protein
LVSPVTSQLISSGESEPPSRFRLMREGTCMGFGDLLDAEGAEGLEIVNGK